MRVLARLSPFLPCFVLVTCHNPAASAPDVNGSWTYSGEFRSVIDRAPCTILPTRLTFVQRDTAVTGTFDSVHTVCVRGTGADTSTDDLGNQVGFIRRDSIYLLSDRVLFRNVGVIAHNTIDGVILQTSFDSTPGHFHAVRQ